MSELEVILGGGGVLLLLFAFFSGQIGKSQSWGYILGFILIGLAIVVVLSKNN